MPTLGRRAGLASVVGFGGWLGYMYQTRLKEATSVVKIREANSGKGWIEVFLSPEQASRTKATHEAFILGHSILLLYDVASAAECETLRLPASHVAALMRESAAVNRRADDHDLTSVLTRMPSEMP